MELMTIPGMAGEYALRFRYDSDMVEWAKTLPGSYYLPTLQLWRVAFDKAVALPLLECLSDNGCSVPGSILRSLREWSGKVISYQRQAEGRSDHLYQYQSRGVKWLLERQCALLADEMGLGKTIQVLAALPDSARVIVVCPACMKYTWAKEISKWRPEFVVQMQEGRGSTGSWPPDGCVYLVNYDILPSKPLSDGLFRGVGQKVLVADEAHYLNNDKTRRTVAFRAMAMDAKRSGGYVWGLTGTPIMNRPLEFWQVLESLQLEKTIFGHFGVFYGFFNAKKEPVWIDDDHKIPLLDAVGEQRTCTVWGVPDERNLPKLEWGILRRERKQVAPELPPKMRRTINLGEISETRLIESCDGAYKKYKKRLDAGKLPPFEMISSLRRSLAEYKIQDMLREVVRYEHAGIPLIVFSAHVAPIEALRKREGWGVITGSEAKSDRQSVVDSFQGGSLIGIGATIGSAGLGITLTRASHALFVDLEWTPAANLQAEDRLCRHGQQSNKIIYTSMVVEHPLETRVFELLREKMTLISSTILPTSNEEAVHDYEKVMSAVESDAALKFEPCPMCGTECEIIVAGSESTRPGIHYIKCRVCEFFCWQEQFGGGVEVHRCRSCGHEVVAKRAGVNSDRMGAKYLSCKQCGNFEWLDPRISIDGIRRKAMLTTLKWAIVRVRIRETFLAKAMIEKMDGGGRVDDAVLIDITTRHLRAYDMFITKRERPRKGNDE